MFEKSPFKIFIVEDDPSYLNFLSYVSELNPDNHISCFMNGRDCLDALIQQKPQLVILDYDLPDYKGQEMLEKIKAYDAKIHVVIITARKDIKTAIHLLKLGAIDYILKDEEAKNRLTNAIHLACQNSSLMHQIDHLKQEISEKYEFSKSIIGCSKAIRKTFSMLEKAVKTNITVSVTGETGTGKELAAKAIHYNSNRSNQPFVAVNIAAIPDELIESELFGHEKGAFTGAINRHTGKFEEAQSGTIFLDEIGEMNLHMQSKLLRVLQEKEIVRLGGNKVIKLNVRVIVATHRNLPEEVKKGNFREDLYYRLLGLPIRLPPLRERNNDILILAKHFLEHFCRENGLGKIRISRQAQEKLLKYSYPGNVRELKSVIELAAVMCQQDMILPEDITFNSVINEQSFKNEELTLREYNLKIIKHLMDKYNHNIMRVAEVLDIGRSTLYRYLKELETTDMEY